jgi:CRISPR-associated protein (TIGR02584 family)
VNEVYVIALLGISPAVVTEMLWYLAAIEKRKVVGVEVWTTWTSWLQGNAALLDTLAELATTLEVPHRLNDPVPAAPEGPLQTGVSVFIPSLADRLLTDFTTQEEAHVFSVAIHRRLRRVTASLDRPVLIGALAGGRKTMSASLTSAFSLYGKKGDILKHVMLHPVLERRLQRQDLTYMYPDREVAGLAPQDHLHVVDFPFFPARSFLDAGPDRLARDFLEAARAELEALQSASTASLQVAPAPRGRAHILIGGARVTVSRITAIAYALLITELEVDEDSLCASGADILRNAGGRVDRHQRRNPERPDDDLTPRTLQNLRRKLHEVLRHHTDLYGLVPQRNANLWAVQVPSFLDTSQFTPEHVSRVLLDPSLSRGNGDRPSETLSEEPTKR